MTSQTRHLIILQRRELPGLRTSGNINTHKLSRLRLFRDRGTVYFCLGFFAFVFVWFSFCPSQLVTILQRTFQFSKLFKVAEIVVKPLLCLQIHLLNKRKISRELLKSVNSQCSILTPSRTIFDLCFQLNLNLKNHISVVYLWCQFYIPFLLPSYYITKILNSS